MQFSVRHTGFHFTSQEVNSNVTENLIFKTIKLCSQSAIICLQLIS